MGGTPWEIESHASKEFRAKALRSAYLLRISGTGRARKFSTRLRACFQQYRFSHYSRLLPVPLASFASSHRHNPSDIEDLEMIADFGEFFRQGSGGHNPRPYQARLATEPWPETRIIPTGFGKTAAIFAAWLWKLAHGDQDTPRRLAYCLPMRTLVEQTASVAGKWVRAAEEILNLKVECDVLMGGSGAGLRSIPPWMLNPESPAILVGTQDILISAALMRGYGVSRYRWPVDFALLNNDTFWVFDEVQLAGDAIATSAQLEAFRKAFGVGRSSRTLWMSATLDPNWLRTVDFTPADPSRPHDLTAEDLATTSHLWEAGKTLQRLNIAPDELEKKTDVDAYVVALAKRVIEKAQPATNTIVFVNTVARAQAVFERLRKDLSKDPGPELLLVHSRFRRADRDALISRLTAPTTNNGRIVVTTQALEAGVDVTSATMFTEVAPWSSLVQRFGRCNRYGECASGAHVYWVDLPDSAARPYSASDFVNAREILETLNDCGPASLASVPLPALPRGAVLRKRDLLDLFDTEPDLSGFDVDISPYVRDAQDTDLRLFWRIVEGDNPPPNAPGPGREELCPAPIGGVKQFLARRDVRAWLWDTLTQQWRRVGKDEVFPGQRLWIDAESGGYDPEKGFDPSATQPVIPVPGSTTDQDSMEADLDTYGGTVRVSLAKHSVHVRDEAEHLADRLGLSDDERQAVIESALWHDAGKGHEAFMALTGGVTPPLAKWPRAQSAPKSPRPNFRHEFASALAFLANRNWDSEASLCAYLIAAHHGKIRLRLRALPTERHPPDSRLFARGVWQGDVLPEIDLGAVTVPRTILDLDLMQLGDGTHGPSWQARTQQLLQQYGPFRLAWLEALVRIADWRASAAEEARGHDDI